MSECLKSRVPTPSWADLPQEIWLHIFRLATSTPTSHEDCELQYSPFRTISFLDRDWSSMQVTLNVKRTIVRVCKAWRVLAMEVMFEIVRIRHGTEGLQKGLEKSGEELGVDAYGRWIRRVEISPQIIDFDPLNPVEIPEILRRCTQAGILVRPYITPTGNYPLSPARFAPDRHFPLLPALKRIDWWTPPDSPPTSASERHEFLDDLLRNSPNLSYLSLGDGSAFLASVHPNRYTDSHAIILPSLTTLRLESQTEPLYRRILHWSLPRLTHLILNPGQFQLSTELLMVFGSQLHVVELMWCNIVYHRECFKQILRQCPNLRELNYHVDTAFPPPIVLASHQNLQCIRLHLRLNSLASDKVLAFVMTHFGMFAGHSLPAFERIVLYGSWNPILSDHRFHSWKRDLPDCSCVIELSDGTKVR